jgi:hypothetical protein
LIKVDIMWEHLLENALDTEFTYPL